LYDISVEKVLYHPLVPTKTIYRESVGGIVARTDSQYEIELLYLLTAPNSPLEKLLRIQEDGKYRLIIFKETLISETKRATGVKIPPRFAFMGWCLSHKKKNDIFIDSNYFQVGALNKLNIRDGSRDVQSEVKRGHWKDTTGAGVENKFTFKKDREDEIKQRMKEKEMRFF